MPGHSGPGHSLQCSHNAPACAGEVKKNDTQPADKNRGDFTYQCCQIAVLVNKGDISREPKQTTARPVSHGYALMAFVLINVATKLYFRLVQPESR